MSDEYEQLLTDALREIDRLRAELAERAAECERLRADVEHAISRLARHADILICSDVGSHLQAALSPPTGAPKSE